MRSLALPLAVLACLALLVGGALFLLSDKGARPVPVAQPSAQVELPAPVPEPAPSDLRSVGGGAVAVPGGAVATSVAWPVEIELELVEPSERLRGEGIEALGSGRTARLRGQVTIGDRVGTPATLSFEAGLNAGRTIATNAQGYFGANDLYAGVSLVRVRGAAIAGSLREVRLLRDKETLLALDFGAPGSVGGTVFDEAGKPMSGVEVELDGRSAVTDDSGIYRFGGIPGGSDVVLVLRAKGYATQYHSIGVAAVRSIGPEHYKFTMERGGALEVAVTRAAGAPGPARVLLSTGVKEVKTPYAWHLFGPYDVMPGNSIRIDDLPPMRISVRIEHAGARAKPAHAVALVRPNNVEIVRFELEPAASLGGRVIDGEGLAVPDAVVRLEAPDRAKATFGHLGIMPGDFELSFYPGFGVAAGETRSDHQGRFTLSTWPEQVPTAYLVAESRDGRLRGGRAVRADAGEVELVLRPAEEGRARLVLDFPGRSQGLPVEVSINGQLRPEVVLDVEQPLDIEGLAPGRWRLRARWNGELLFGGAGHDEIDIEGHERRSLSLPTGAILGQDSETLERARG